MRISIKSDYALKAMLELALNFGKSSLKTGDIARKQGIPKRYLEHLLLMLKGSGLVTSFRGKEGGYSLSKRPGEIRVIDIFEAVEGPVDLFPGARGGRPKKRSVISGVWEMLQRNVSEALASVTLESLVSKKRQVDGVKNYSI